MDVVSVVGVEGVVSVGYNRLYRVIILHIQMFLSGFAVLFFPPVPVQVLFAECLCRT